MIRITTFAGKRVAVFGLGASGIATAKALVAGGADVVASDDSAAGMQAAAEADLKTADLKDANWAVFSALVLAPGVPLTHPQPHWAVRLAKLAGVEVIGDLELFVRERRAQGFDVPFIAITGTNGKSTTTALTAHILRQVRSRHAGRRQHRHRHAVARGIRAGSPLRHRVLVVSDRSGAESRRFRRRAAQCDARPSRPARHHRELRGGKGATSAGRQKGRCRYR